MKKLLCLLVAVLLVIPTFAFTEDVDITIFDFQINFQSTLEYFGNNINVSYSDVSVPIEKDAKKSVIVIPQDEALIRANTFENSDILEFAALFMPYGVTGKRVRGLMGAFVSSVSCVAEPDVLYKNGHTALSSVYDDNKHKLNDWIYQKGVWGNYDLYLFSPIDSQQILVYCHNQSKMTPDSLQTFLNTMVVEPFDGSILQNTVYVNHVSLSRLDEDNQYKATITIQNTTEQTVTCLKYASRGIDSFGEMSSIYNIKTEDVQIKPGDQVTVYYTIISPDSPSHCFYIEEIILDDSEIIELAHPHIFRIAFD